MSVNDTPSCLNFFYCQIFYTELKTILNVEAYFHEIKVHQFAVSVVFLTIFPHNTLLRNQFKSTISTTHQQLLNQPKKNCSETN